MPDETALIISPALKQRAQDIPEALKAARMSIVTAESCTAGMIAAVLSHSDGAGELLHGGFVTYTKEQKTKALGVSGNCLKKRRRQRGGRSPTGGGRARAFTRLVEPRRQWRARPRAR